MKVELQDSVQIVEPIQGMVIEIEDDNSDVVWIFKTLDGIRVEGGAFCFKDFLAHIEEFYGKNF